MKQASFLSAESQKRYDAFWDCDVYDRFLMFVAVGGKKIGKPEEISDEEFITYKRDNIDFRLRESLARHDGVRYYMDAFPTQFINYGPGSLAAYIGGNYQYAPNTIWFDRNPIITDWENPPRVAFDEESPLWKKTVEFTDAVLKDGSMYASITDIGGTVDVVASLRGTQELLFDLYDYPEEVKAMTREVGACWKQAYTKLADRVAQYQDGFTSWMPIWCRQRYSPIQCDFSAMLSPDMFKEFVLPDLIDLTEFLDKSIYHLDGPGEIPHLDHLLSIPRLNAIQWTVGAGKGKLSDECWFERYAKSQAAGKGLVLFVEDPEGAEKLMRHLSPRGVFMSVGRCDDAAARDLTALAESLGIKG